VSIPKLTIVRNCTGSSTTVQSVIICVHNDLDLLRLVVLTFGKSCDTNVAFSKILYPLFAAYVP